MNKWRTLSTGILSFLLSLFLFFSCKKTAQIIEIDLDVFTVKDHLVIGQTMADQIAHMPEEFNILDTTKYEDAYEYLHTLINTLKLTAVVKHRDDFNWQVTILHDDDIESAFTLPGGHIYVYTGLLHFLKAEHELMAILANEIAYADKELSALALKEEHGGVFLGNITLGKEVKELAEVVEDFPLIEFSTQQVYDADEYAIALMCPFQYDISGLKGFLSRANESNIEWIVSKRGDDLNKRLANIENHSNECGEGGVTNYEQYRRKTKNFLP